MTGVSGKRRAAITVIAMLGFLPLGVFADVSNERDLRVAIDPVADDSQVFIYLTDTSHDVRLHDLQLGESRSIAGANGLPILLTRVEDGLELNIDGQVIRLPEFFARHQFVEAKQHDATFVDRNIMQAVQIIHADATTADEDDIVIVSADRIDPATRDGIRALLSSAGYSADVTFLDTKPARINARSLSLSQ